MVGTYGWTVWPVSEGFEDADTGKLVQFDYWFSMVCFMVASMMLDMEGLE